MPSSGEPWARLVAGTTERDSISLGDLKDASEARLDAC